MSNLELVDTGFNRKQWFLIDRDEDTCISCKKKIKFGYYCKICDKMWCIDCEKDYSNKLKQTKGNPLCRCPVLLDDHHSYNVTCNKKGEKNN